MTPPQVRRHRPGALDQPRDRAPAGRRDPLVSTPGQGSTFTLYLPLSLPAADADAPLGERLRARRGCRGPRTNEAPARGSPRARRSPSPRLPRRGPSRAPTWPQGRRGQARQHRGRGRMRRRRPAADLRSIADDRGSIRPGDRVLLIVEGDAEGARSLLGLARDRGCKGLVAAQGSTALLLARRFQPTPSCSTSASAHGRVALARSAQARPDHAPHPGPHDLRDRPMGARFRAWRHRPPQAAGRRPRRSPRRSTGCWPSPPDL